MASTAESVGHCMVLYDVSWDVYTKLVDALSDNRFRHTYQEGTLEMMSPSADHERIKSFLGRLIEMASLELGVRIRSEGSATRRDKRLMHGLEPDESYFVEGRAKKRGRSSVGQHKIPDLVVEVDMRRTMLSRLTSYAILGVREVWRYSRGTVEFLRLDAEREYNVVEQSIAFPLVASKDVTHYVSRLRADENSLILEFVARLRKLQRDR